MPAYAPSLSPQNQLFLRRIPQGEMYPMKGTPNHSPATTRNLSENPHPEIVRRGDTYKALPVNRSRKRLK